VQTKEPALPTYALGVLLGCALQTAQPQLWPQAPYTAMAAFGLVATLAALWRCGKASPRAGNAWQRGAAHAGLALSGFALAFGLTGWRAHALIADRLDPSTPTAVFTVRGTVVDLPVLYADSTRFVFEVEQPAPPGVPSRLALSWYSRRDRHADRPAPPPRVHPGQQWRLSVRLKPPHGLANPGGHDGELTLFRQGIGATGTVSRSGPPPLLLGVRSAPGDWIAQLRDHLRQRMIAALRREPTPRTADGMQDLALPADGDRAALQQRASARAPAALVPSAETVIALALGDQAAISPQDWAVYRTTGVAHLMSISGLHVTLLAWIGMRVIGWLWRQTARLPRPWTLTVPAPTVAAWAALLLATAYALIAGWGVPAQRTLLMLAVVLLLRQRGLRADWRDVLALALIAVLLWDPWAVRQAGFWLSFVAVGLLFVAADAPQRTVAQPPSAAFPGWLQRLGQKLRDASRTQWIATIGLLPLTLLFFQQIAVVSPLANALAIPLITLAVTPLAIFGLLLPAPLDAWVWRVAAWLQHGLDQALRSMAHWPLAQWHAAAPDALSLTLAMLGVLTLALPWGWRLRAPGLLLCLPLGSNPGEAVAPGGVELWFADVGQGMAVIVRTARHTLVYDTGPQQAPGVDAGSRVLLPLLHGLGARRIDRVVVSHDDSDHAGGAAALAQAYPHADLLTSAPPQEAARWGFSRLQTCAAGQRWNWDGVEFRIISPLPGAPPRSANASSCVLHISARGGSALLTGDIDQAQERALHAHDALPYADVLLAPHHGSKSSSSDALLDTVMPRAAVVQAGYRNPHGHPHPLVVERYAARGIALWRTDLHGALRWRDDAPDTFLSWRAATPHYWGATPAPTTTPRAMPQCGNVQPASSPHTRTAPCG
jgi:competence protein ComEC